jgi:dipeptidyl aminopeptidase/acylaminoacyl peptidase
VSPDGRTVAFIGGLMSDFGSVGGDVYAVALAGGAPRNLTPGFRGSFTSLSPWRSASIHATALVGADTAHVLVDPGGGAKITAQMPVSFQAGEGHVSLSADETVAAAVLQDFEHAPRIVLHDFKQAGPPLQLTHDNDASPANVRAKSLTWTSGGFTVQGWLLTPLNPPAGKAPLLVQVHGGPAAASTPRYLGAQSLDKRLLDAGYAILLPNPRGSYGQGEAFTAANRRDFGGGDLADDLAGADAAARAAPVDVERMGVYGGSYGGFMSMWAVTHTNRFKASVASAGLSNWSSYYGTNGIDKWMIPYFGKSFYEDPAIYDRLSAVRYVKDVRTPTLIMVGERDIECPPGQSIEFWHGLREYGVPTTLVIYEGEGHGLRDPKHQKDSADRTVAWFDAYLKK